MPTPNHTVISGDPTSSWILHVPYAATAIPPGVRERIVLADDALAAELRAMTYAHTDLLAARIADRVAGPRPWSFVNRYSRLIVDPERFPVDAVAPPAWISKMGAPSPFSS